MGEGEIVDEVCAGALDGPSRRAWSTLSRPRRFECVLATVVSATRTSMRQHNSSRSHRRSVTMAAIVSLELLPALPIVCSSVVARLMPSIGFHASRVTAHRRQVFLLFGGFAAPFALLNLRWVAAHLLVD